jgi:hypothetical protein
MNRTPGLLAATMRGSRWILPWLSMLALSASIAYAVIAAAPAAPPAIDAPSASLATPLAKQTQTAVERAGPATIYISLPADSWCLIYLGGGNPTPTNEPQMTAPPAWCGQH